MADTGTSAEKTVVESRFPRGILTPRTELISFAAKLLRVSAESDEYVAGAPNVHMVAERMADHLTTKKPGDAPDIRLFDEINWLVQLDLPVHLQEQLRQT